MTTADDGSNPGTEDAEIPAEPPPQAPAEPESEHAAEPVAPGSTPGMPEPEPAPKPSGYAHPMAIVARSLALSSLIGVALVFWFLLAFGGRWVTPFLAANDLEMPHRMTLIKSLIVSGLCGGSLGTIALVLAWRKRWGIAKLERLLWFCSPALLLPFLPMIYRPKPWIDRPDVLVVLVLAVALVAEVLLVQSLQVIPERVTRALGWLSRKTPEIWRQHGPLIVVLTATTFYIAFMSFFGLRWHHKLGTHNFDLSIDNNLAYSALKGAPLSSKASLGPYLVLPIYALSPRPETLIVIQSFLCGLGALPLFGFAKRHVSSWIAALCALAYLAYVPLHSANFGDSKFLSFSGFFVLATFWAAEYRRWVLFGLAFVAAAIIGQGVPIGLVIGGSFLLLSGYRPIAGGAMAVIASLWLVILRFFMMDGGGWFPELYRALSPPGQSGSLSVIKTLLTNFLFVLNQILEKDKLLFVLHLLVPLALLPLRRWYLWVSLLPGTVLTLLVTDYKPAHGFTFQYVMHWIPYLFLAVPLAIEAIQKSGEPGRKRAFAVIGAMGLASTALSHNYGAFARRPESVRGGAFYVDFAFSPEEAERYRLLKSLISLLPPEASVVASENVGPHVSSRKHMFALRRSTHDAEYMLVGRPELDFEQARQLFTDAVKSGAYGVVKREADFVLLRKGHDPSDNQQLAVDWEL